MSIALEQHAAEFTQAIIDVYKEEVPTPSFLRSFFTTVSKPSKFVEIWVQRGTEKIAVDVNRGGGGRRNQFSKESQKVFLAPFYDEYFDATSLDTYDNMVNMGAPAELVGSTVRNIGEKLQTLRDKINRAKELQASQVFETGVVQLNSGDNIDFKRKATSIVDPGAYWGTTTTDIESQLIAAGTFLRTDGKSSAKVLNMIMSSTAWIALKKSDYFTKKANYNNVVLLDINMPIADSTGASYHGQITAGSFILNCWTYDETYETDAGVDTRYLDANNVIILPATGTRFVMAHAGLPKIIADPARAEFNFINNMAAEFMVYNNIDTKRFAHNFGVMSAPIAVPVSIDRIYTLQAISAEIEQG